MNRAEKAAYKQYPLDRLMDLERNAKRVGYIVGYRQAEKDTIERAIKWLCEQVNIGTIQTDSLIRLGNDFREAMEEEQ